MVKDYQFVMNVVEGGIVVTSRILEKSAEIFRKAQHENTRMSWRGYVEATVKLTLELSEGERQELLDEVRRRREALSDPNEERYLWVFSHGSDKIFENFLSVHTGLHYVLAEFLLETNREKSDDRILNNEVVKELVQRYAALLRCSDCEYFFTSSASSLTPPAINLIPTPLSTPESIARVTAKWRPDIARQEINEYLSQYFLPPCLVSVSDDQKTALENAVAERLKIIGGYDWDVPPHWRHIYQIEETLYGVLRDGNWPTFSMLPRPTLDANRVEKCWVHPVSGMAELAGRYLPKETISVLARLGAVMDGRLPVGLKVHCLKPDELNVDLFYKGAFHLERASACIILPAVGSISAAEELLGMIGEKTGLSFLDNLDFQIQVCSPGELSAKHAAILGICFYLGSDKLRRYDRSDFVTTHKETGGRLIVYGAGNLNHNFAWWGKEETGRLCTEAIPPSVKNRTDVLTCSSLLDIDNVNLVATLLIHNQYGGFWGELGERFVRGMEALLDGYHLSHLLEASWIYRQEDKADDAAYDRDGTQFFGVFSELMALAFAECSRIREERGFGEDDVVKRGILSDTQSLLRSYRAELSTRATQEIIGGTKWFRSMRISQE